MIQKKQLEFLREVPRLKSKRLEFYLPSILINSGEDVILNCIENLRIEV